MDKRTYNSAGMDGYSRKIGLGVGVLTTRYERPGGHQSAKPLSDPVGVD
jgi:hypothetical protein